MATSHQHRLSPRPHLHRSAPTPRATVDGSAPDTATGSPAVAAVRTTDIAVAGLRVLLGFVFLWAFLDKTFGLGYATASGKGWVDGGSPTKGFLSHVDVGPMAGTLRGWAGEPWADWLFMLGLLGVGVALILGIGLRLAALSGTAMMALMWIAEWPPAKHLDSGKPSSSTNPFADYHVMYAISLIALAAVAVGSRLGLGALWARLPIVRDHRWLL
ncbi:DoxX family membrane protein [Embleya scabrispora]|uniref:DoxX family membrane protein n=1 Tax=Embleya scabrispora TaxID=159449 RepID=UPI00037A2BD4|nr:DoxX family membrane protein [Embleya scabrispora]MYS84031.1 DoxX family membrane protein [Streptomyces sp. SID5474]